MSDPRALTRSTPRERCSFVRWHSFQGAVPGSELSITTCHRIYSLTVLGRSWLKMLPMYRCSQDLNPAGED